MASSAVFQTTELRELIMENFSTLDLVRAGRVCRDWRASLSSVSLKHKVFLAPVTTPTMALVCACEKDSSLTRYERARPICRPQVAPVDFSVYNSAYRIRAPPQVIKLHPLLEQPVTEDMSLQYVNIKFSAQYLMNFSSLGPWAEAFVSQPPVREMELTFVARVVGRFKYEAVLQDDGGLRLRHVWEAVRTGVEKFEEWNDDRFPRLGARDEARERKENECWGKKAVGQIAIIIRDCIADVSPWVKRAVREKA